MIDLEADIAEVLTADNFSTEAVFATTPTPTTIMGEFREGSDAVYIGRDLAIEAVEPSFTCLTSEGEAIRQNTSVEILSRDFKVVRNQKIGTGVNCLYLKTG